MNHLLSAAVLTDTLLIISCLLPLGLVFGAIYAVRRFNVRQSGWLTLGRYKSASRPVGVWHKSNYATFNGIILCTWRDWGSLDIVLAPEGLYLACPRPSTWPLLIPWTSVAFLRIPSGIRAEFRIGEGPGVIFGPERPIADEMCGYLPAAEKIRYKEASAATSSTWPTLATLVRLIVIFAIIAFGAWGVLLHYMKAAAR